MLANLPPKESVFAYCMMNTPMCPQRDCWGRVCLPLDCCARFRNGERWGVSADPEAPWQSLEVASRASENRRKNLQTNRLLAKSL